MFFRSMIMLMLQRIKYGRNGFFHTLVLQIQTLDSITLKKIQLYQVDAFTDKVFGGNPAAVCVLDAWLENDVMQQIAAENNLAETAFVVPKGDSYEIRWFTPTVEVDLCGHATLAAAYVLFRYYDHPSNKIVLHSRNSGQLTVTKQGEELTLDFPVDTLSEIDTPQVLVEALDKAPVAAYKGKTDFLLLYPTQQDIEELVPDFRLVERAGGRGVIVTAPGDEVDFVSRFFCPNVGINEDPVTGSAHTTLTPYWSQKLDKTILTAKQLSRRQGNLTCELDGDRVKITGKAVTYLTGEIEV
ncbi:PhzF family phenazine biosynthesis protein [Pontibacter anaerobius]|uniref:PhzF family phenazine biosynthesis protein n=1 Tax=Pontibacter anaerobius TaxID=2993940 RepID=A0ABT3RE58_9BACT|nr:PhzF family phenazine biosynthesis protein [Pontibacter anaerobius]MCX2739909.1 PhzF family phenazine biosynthesis protein [Pontibacter anaerobius]